MPPTPQRLTLSLAGLAAVAASIWVAFEQPYTLWPWLLLLVAMGCAMVARRMD